MNIRRATAADAEIIAELNHAVHEIHVAARPDFFKPLVIDDELLAITRQRLAGEDDYGFIAEVDGTPVGYVFAEVREREGNPFSHPLKVLGLDQISVNPEYRSQGIGEALMQQVYDVAIERGVDRVWLSVWSFNIDAIRFYERLGFDVLVVRMEKLLDHGR
jgi:ribosomal protein S18 acetylase RimI-like enzyme